MKQIKDFCSGLSVLVSGTFMAFEISKFAWIFFLISWLLILAENLFGLFFKRHFEPRSSIFTIVGLIMTQIIFENTNNKSELDICFYVALLVILVDAMHNAVEEPLDNEENETILS